MDLQQYEKYFIYDSPIPYQTQTTLKRIQDIEERLIYINSNEINDDLKKEIIHLNNEIKILNIPLLIYPVKVLDYLNFHIAINCLAIDKNKIPNPKIISMSYLDFLFHLIETDLNGKFYAQMLIEIFNLCIKNENQNLQYFRDTNGKINLVLSINVSIIENNEEKIVKKEFIINKNDFDEIKKIILYQNIPCYDDTYIDPKVEQALQEAQEFMNKNKKKICSLEDQIICVLISTPLNQEKIYNLTIRKFSKILERVDYKLHYSIYKQVEMSGMVSFKEEIDHWMCDLRKNKYSDITAVEVDQLKKKIESV